MELDSHRIPGYQLSAEQQNVVDLALAGESVLIVGKAGVGKSFTIRKVMESLAKRPTITLAPTGVAAINVGGLTIHRLLGLAKNRIGALNTLNIPLEYASSTCIILDEVSMIRADLMDQLSIACQRLTRNDYEPFGGMQVIMVGDPGQLPPVLPRKTDPEHKEITSSYASPYFFSSFAFTQLKPNIIELTKIFRQSPSDTATPEEVKDATRFIKILNFIRTGTEIPAVTTFLNSKHRVKEPVGVTLCPTNKRAKEINQAELMKLDSPLHSIQCKTVVHLLLDDEGYDDADFKPSEYPTDEVLELKVGAKVMIIKNIYRDEQLILSNGDVGTILEIKEIRGKVESCLLHVPRLEHSLGDPVFELFLYDGTWHKTRATEQTKVKSHGGMIEYEGTPNKEIISSFIQLPLRLAYAITIHKSQGSTISTPMTIDLTSRVPFVGGMYTALSRGTSLSNLHILGQLNKSDVRVAPEISDFLLKGLDSKYCKIKKGSKYEAVLKQVEEINKQTSALEDSGDSDHVPF